MDQVRRVLARHLRGSGVELGPGDHPFPLPYPGVERLFVDKWTAEQNRKLFDELGDDPPFPEPDIICDFDVDGLGPIGDASQDYVIASHVIEHMAEPLGFLRELDRVMRPNATLILLVPDRRRTFDRFRQPTPLAHLIDEHARGVTTIDDDHLWEFLHNAEESSIDAMPADPEGQREFLEWHRNRSIHAHCWSEDEFLEVVVYAMETFGLRWEFVDGVIPDEEGEMGSEFGFVFRKSALDDDPTVYAERFRTAWNAWRQVRQELLDEVASERARHEGTLDELHGLRNDRAIQLTLSLRERAAAMRNRVRTRAQGE
jgi:SAM-dependent methyltransferase